MLDITQKRWLKTGNNISHWSNVFTQTFLTHISIEVNGQKTKKDYIFNSLAETLFFLL